MRDLVAGEYRLTDPAEILRRQVHPAMFDGQIMKGAFMDGSDWMSTLRGSVAAEEAYRRWTEDQGYESLGTYGIVVEIAEAEGLPCISDAEALKVKDHASVVSEDLPSNGAKQRAARNLRAAAEEMGPLYAPPKEA